MQPLISSNSIHPAQSNYAEVHHQHGLLCYRDAQKSSLNPDGKALLYVNAFTHFKNAVVALFITNHKIPATHASFFMIMQIKSDLIQNKVPIQAGAWNRIINSLDKTSVIEKYLYNIFIHVDESDDDSSSSNSDDAAPGVFLAPIKNYRRII